MQALTQLLSAYREGAPNPAYAQRAGIASATSHPRLQTLLDLYRHRGSLPTYEQLAEMVP